MKQKYIPRGRWIISVLMNLRRNSSENLFYPRSTNGTTSLFLIELGNVTISPRTLMPELFQGFVKFLTTFSHFLSNIQNRSAVCLLPFTTIVNVKYQLFNNLDLPLFSPECLFVHRIT